MKFFQKIKMAVSTKAALFVAAAAAASSTFLPSVSHAALPPEADAMLTAATGYLADIAAGVGTLGLAAIGIAIVLAIIGIVMLFIRRPGGA